MDNLMDYYINYKINYLKRCAITIMDSDDEYLEYVILRYIDTYINTYYYNIFDTIDNFSDMSLAIKEELDGRRYELLYDLAPDELIDSNERYARRKGFISSVLPVIFFLVELDRFKFSSSEDISRELLILLDKNHEVKKIIGNNTLLLEKNIRNNFNNMNKFLGNDDDNLKLDYQLFKDKDDLVNVVIIPSISLLQDNYKSSLLDRVYRDERLKKQLIDLLCMKFIKQLIVDDYLGRKMYKRYFIQLDDYLFDDKDNIKDILNMLNNSFIMRYVVIGLSNTSYMSCRSLINKYKYCLACIQDFSHINDINNKLSNIDNSMIYKYIIVSGYKSDDLEDIMNYSSNNLEGILFSKEG